MSYLLLMIFWPMGSKHCHTNERSVWTSRRTMLENKPHLVTFQESISVSLLIFQPTLVYISWFEVILFLVKLRTFQQSATYKHSYTPTTTYKGRDCPLTENLSSDSFSKYMSIYHFSPVYTVQTVLLANELLVWILNGK